MRPLSAIDELRAGLTGADRAYVDRDWIDIAHATPLPALFIGESTVAWNREEGERERGLEPDTLAARVFLSAAGSTAKLMPEDAEGYAVCGAGEIAEQTARLLGISRANEPPPPEAELGGAVDFTGDPETIARLAKAVRPRGMLVLGGERLGRTLPMNLYPDIHLRGLRLSAVDPIALALEAEAGASGDEGLVSLPAEAVADFPGHGRWYRIASEQTTR